MMQARKVLLAIRRSRSRSEYAIDLKQNGFEVAIADHGLECLEVLERFSPDVVVIEPELLWGGGDGVLAVINEDTELQGLPVLVLTNNCNRTAVYSVSQFPVCDFWVQPVSPERLTGRITRLAFEHHWPITAKRFFSGT